MGKKLSIIIPVYNCPSINKAIESIPGLEEIEIIVIDGKSNLETIDAINQYRDRIDCFISEQDQGLYDAMNKGIRMARGEWVLTLAADDRLLCNPLDILGKYDRSDCDLICGCLIARDYLDRYYIIEPHPDLKKLELECTLGHPGTFFRKMMYDQFGEYDLQYRCGADHEFFLRLLKQGAHFKLIPEIITFFSFGGVSTKKPILAFQEDIRISDQYDVSYFSSRINYVIRIMKYYGAKGKDILHLPHTTNYMNEEQLKEVLVYHPEITSDSFLNI